MRGLQFLKESAVTSLTSGRRDRLRPAPTWVQLDQAVTSLTSIEVTPSSSAHVGTTRPSGGISDVGSCVIRFASVHTGVGIHDRELLDVRLPDVPQIDMRCSISLRFLLTSIFARSVSSPPISSCRVRDAARLALAASKRGRAIFRRRIANRRAQRAQWPPKFAW
jgi:hypothetical protein